MSRVTEDADTVARFLKEPVVQSVFDTLHKDAYDGFRQATTDAELREAHALERALTMLETAFRAVMDNGERERLEEQSAERRLPTR